ncbi:hypothetical protein EZL74_08525 [Flavobacterium silvisoli]|uniref:HNH nuclease domain-containing protein n=1 Tax=Flavobacterium silvisoli TaxID=2529433 RepID=A0A4Q9YX17_9FLAO|nr:HNH endonuclease [Flavobacterium silvisoli]TBX68346.1 hypothetical protein EZL74_08525 [Flavobacterium silvisoli]
MLEMNGRYLNKILETNAKHALYREDGKWYHNLKKFPGVLFDKNGYVIFNSIEEYNNEDALQIKKDLHIIDGIQNLKQYHKFTALELQLIEGIEVNESNNDSSNSEDTVRVLRTIDTILRNKALVQRVKKLYNNTCQLCGTQLRIRKNNYYSEVHHIVPLGKPHNGKDSLDNMICVCPNCHVQLDLKSISINKNSLLLNNHEINIGYIDKHNSFLKS